LTLPAKRKKERNGANTRFDANFLPVDDVGGK